MELYLLDTSAFSDLMRAEPRIKRWLSTLSEDDRVITCVIVRGEILFGISRLDEGRRRTELQEKAGALFRVVPCEPVPEAAGGFYAEVKLARQRQGLALDENDLWLAATALTRSSFAPGRTW